MPAKFIIGRAGTGKTASCIHETVRACQTEPLGPPILWLVPKQATFQTERDLCCARGLGGFFRVRVMSLDELGRLVLAEVGGSAVPEVTDLGRRMILGSILRKLGDSLRFFGSVARKPGLATTLDQTLGELERSGSDIGDVMQKIAGRTAENSGLQAKLDDLRAIHAAYSAYLGSDRLDGNRRLLQALERVKGCALLRGATVYVDGFYDFTDYEAKMLAGIAGVCDRMQIAITMDGASPLLQSIHQNLDEMSLFHRTEMAYRRLSIALKNGNVKIDEPIILETCRRFVSTGLQQIEKWDAPGSGHGVQFIEAPDRRAEVDAAARQIGDLVRAGLRYRDIAVLARDLDEYHDLISASFAEHNIPYFADRRRTAAHHPLIQMIRAIVGIARTNWGFDEMMSLVKSGLTGLTSEQGDELENFVLMHGIRHTAWITEEKWTESEAARQVIVDRLKPYVDSERGAKTRTVRQRVMELMKVLEVFEVRRRLAEWIAEAEKSGRLEEADEHRQVWINFCELVQQLVELLAEEVASLDELQGMLEGALETFDLALTPPTVDQVLVGGVDRTRTPAIRAAIIIGLNEGQFPRGSRKETVFSDGDRRTLWAAKIEVETDSRRRALDENFLGYVAFTRASERLILIRHTADGEGKPIPPGSLWRHARAMAGGDIAVIPPHAKPSAATVGTPRQLVTNLMRWVRSDGEDGPVLPALYQWLANRTCDDSPMDRMRRRSWRALSYVNDAAIAPETATRLFNQPVTVNQLEGMAACPFQHFVKNGLGLRERAERQVDGRDITRIYREVLDGILREQRDWRAIRDSEIRGIVEAHVARIGKTLRGAVMLSSARNQHLLRRAAETLELVIRTQRAAAERGKFQSGSGRRTISLAVKEVAVNGWVDRVDVSSDGTAVAMNYRLGRADKLSIAEAYWGISISLLAALAAMEDEGFTPGGALNVQMLRTLGDDMPGDIPDPTVMDLATKPRGIFTEQAVSLLDSTLGTGPSQVISAKRKVDGDFAKGGDVASAEGLRALLKRIRERMGELIDEVRSGKVSIHPYRLGDVSPCAECGYQDICRFEAGENSYRFLAGKTLADLVGGGK